MVLALTKSHGGYPVSMMQFIPYLLRHATVEACQALLRLIQFSRFPLSHFNPLFFIKKSEKCILKICAFSLFMSRFVSS